VTGASPVPMTVPYPTMGVGARLMLLVCWGAGTLGGCSEPCCSVDEFPINLLVPASPNPEAAGLRVSAGDPGRSDREPFPMSFDTGSALTFFRRRPERQEGAQLVVRDFDILDPGASPLPAQPIVRGRFRHIEVLPLNLDPTGPDAILGGALLRNFSVQFNFAMPTPTVTLWSRQGASDSFLSSAGFSVLHFGLLGGAELTALSRPDFLGLTGPVAVPATRIVLRGCGWPRAFDPVNESQAQNRCCQRGDEVAPTQATGTDLALMLATGVGPLVLSQSAWNRLAGSQDPTPPVPQPGADLPVPSLPAPITNVKWSTLPRLALVDQESSDSTNAGPCVDLGRARRLEWVEHHQSEAACAQPCDTDPRDLGKAQNAAAYVEIGGDIPVAIIEDGTPFLQGLRAEIRPEGPEIDGLIGAGVLSHMAMEIDYKNQPARALLTCSPVSACAGADRTTCWTSPRCPRLANPGDSRSCFCQPRRQLPPTCMSSGCQ
jgi:hypothetical protein